MLAKIRPYSKTLLAVAGAALVALNESGVFADRPWFTVLVSVATVAGVYTVKNTLPPPPPPADSL